MKPVLVKMIAAASLLSFAACSSTTMIRSSDPQAKIYVDGELRGTGSVTHSDTKIVGSTTMVSLRKEGCEERNYTFSRNEEFDVGACIGGVFALVPFLWIQKYRPERTYEFTCNSTAKSGSRK